MADINAFLAAQAVAFVDDEADIQAILQELLRDHIDGALDVYPSPPPNEPVMGIEDARQLALSASQVLREGGDLLSADLL